MWIALVPACKDAIEGVPVGILRHEASPMPLPQHAGDVQFEMYNIIKRGML